MKKFLIAALLLFSISSMVRAQNTVVVGSGMVPAGPTLPTTCNPANVGDPDAQAQFYHTTSAGGAIGLYTCTALNTWIVVGSGSSSGNVPPAAGPLPEFASYTIYINSGTVYARNNSTGAIDYSGSDAAVVVNAAINNISTTCGTLYFQKGIYPINSLTSESTGGYTNWFYGIAFPPTTGTANQYCEWSVIGEDDQTNVSSFGVQTSGVIFNVTSTAVASVTATQTIVALWPRPDTSGNHWGAQVRFKNFGVRFPDNQRGYEYGINLWEAADQDVDNVSGDFASNAYTSTKALIANIPLVFITSTKSTKNLQHWAHLGCLGYYTCFEMDSEHMVFERSFAGYTVNPEELGNHFSNNASPITDDTWWNEITNIFAINGPILGAGMTPGSQLNVWGMNFENQPSGTYASSGLWSETNPGYTSGIISALYLNPAAGKIATPVPAALFSSGGQKFQILDASGAPNLANKPASDTFTRPNAANLGPSWTVGAGAGSGLIKITSNAAAITATGSPVGWGGYVSQQFNNDQVSEATIGSVDAAGAVELTVRNPNSTAQTYYAYYANTTAKGFVKCVAATCNVVGPTSGSGGVAAHKLMLKVVTNVAGNAVLTGYYDNVLDVTYTDSSSPILTGYPGILINSPTTLAGDTLTNWIGGSLSSDDGVSSIFGQPNAWTQQQNMPVLGLNGATSGTATLTPPAVAGTSTNAIVSTNNISAPAFTSTVAIGTAPVVVTSTTTVPNLTVSNHPKIQFCGTTSTCSATAEVTDQVVYGSAPLVSGTPSTVTVTGISPAFTSTTSYRCTATDDTTAANNLIKFAAVSGSSFTITGPATTTDVIGYICVGH